MKWRCSMNNSKLFNEVKQSFLQKRLQAEEKSNELIENLCKDPTFNDLYKNYTANQIKLMRAEVNSTKQELSKQLENLTTKINNFLKPKKLTINSLAPKYDCPICNDTGIVNGKFCECIKKEIKKRKNNLLNTKTKFFTFKDCNPSIMEECDKKASEILKKWCNNYPDIKKININLIGAPGVGKTFLLECVANELITAGNEVCFKTAFEFNELARLYHIGKSFEFTTLLDAEILIIDDLGSEPMFNNVTKEYLYNLINTRQSNFLPTFISTNLSLDNLLDRYDERIFSRLTNKNLSINIELNSKNKRLKSN